MKKMSQEEMRKVKGGYFVSGNRTARAIRYRFSRNVPPAVWYRYH